MEKIAFFNHLKCLRNTSVWHKSSVTEHVKLMYAYVIHCCIDVGTTSKKALSLSATSFDILHLEFIGRR